MGNWWSERSLLDDDAPLVHLGDDEVAKGIKDAYADEENEKKEAKAEAEAEAKAHTEEVKAIVRKLIIRVGDHLSKREQEEKKVKFKSLDKGHIVLRELWERFFPPSSTTEEEKKESKEIVAYHANYEAFARLHGISNDDLDKWRSIIKLAPIMPIVQESDTKFVYGQYLTSVRDILGAIESGDISAAEALLAEETDGLKTLADVTQYLKERNLELESDAHAFFKDMHECHASIAFHLPSSTFDWADDARMWGFGAELDKMDEEAVQRQRAFFVQMFPTFIRAAKDMIRDFNYCSAALATVERIITLLPKVYS